jgi:hypothetical protein
MNAKNLELTLTNSHNFEVNIIIEPWAEEFRFAPGSRATINIVGEKCNSIEIDVTNDFIIIGSPSGCTAAILIDGVDVGCGLMDTPFP